MHATADEILQFWFQEITPEQQFKVDPTFDLQLLKRFGEAHGAAARCELAAWRATPLGRLAEIILLDQFSRNIFRGSAQSFAQDALALGLAQEAIRIGADGELPVNQRAFLYMPFMHSESLLIHEHALQLFSQPGMEYQYKYEVMHKELIDRFGRYPHRNAVLGRKSTLEELEYVAEHPSPF